MNEMNLNGKDMPWWVKAVSFLGISTIVAGFFMGQSAGVIPSVSAKNTEEIQANGKKIDTLTSILEQTQIIMKEISSQGKQSLLVQQENCLLHAKTDGDKLR